MIIPWDEDPWESVPWYMIPGAQPVEGPPALPSVLLPWYERPSVLFWVLVLAAFVAAEVYARFGKKHQSPSQWIRQQAGAFTWFQWLGTFLFGFLIWHFFWSASRFLDLPWRKVFPWTRNGTPSRGRRSSSIQPSAR